MVPDWVAAYVGLPYVPGGRERAPGLDCWGLVCLVWRERFGIESPRFEQVWWEAHSDNAAIAAVIEANKRSRYQEVAPGAEQAGDAILMRMAGYPVHVGLVVAPGVMLHTHRNVDSCVERYAGFPWSRRVLGFYRPNDHA